MTLAEMQARREYLLKEIQRRGGAAKAPNFLAQLNAINSDIRAARNSAPKTGGGDVPATTTPASGGQGDADGKIPDWASLYKDPKSARAQLTQLENEVKRRGGAAKAPNFEKQRASLSQYITGLENPAVGGPGTGDPGSNNGNPGDRGTGTVGNDKDSPYNTKSVDDFLNAALDSLGNLDLSGAPKILTAGDLAAQRQTTQDALYAEETKYLDRNRARDLAEKKQELANRGIPYNPEAEFDPNTKDLYGRTIGAINENYQSEQQTALNHAITGADQRMATEAGVNKAASDQFVTNAVAGWQSKLDKLNTGNSLLQTLINDYHMTQAEAQAAIDRHSRERIARWGIRAKPSGGGNNSGGGEPAGFEIIS